MLLRMVETSLNSYAIWTYLKKTARFFVLGRLIRKTLNVVHYQGDGRKKGQQF